MVPIFFMMAFRLLSCGSRIYEPFLGVLKGFDRGNDVI